MERGRRQSAGKRKALDPRQFIDGEQVLWSPHENRAADVGMQATTVAAVVVSYNDEEGGINRGTYTIRTQELLGEDGTCMVPSELHQSQPANRISSRKGPMATAGAVIKLASHS